MRVHVVLLPHPLAATGLYGGHTIDIPYDPPSYRTTLLLRYRAPTALIRPFMKLIYPLSVPHIVYYVCPSPFSSRFVAMFCYRELSCSIRHLFPISEPLPLNFFPTFLYL